ncbi:MAG TPA: four helix bundle protein [Candidatus Woesebacteria bacterium]|nr:four helix bundle protein [Candidatus Woesebacteria bacterium]
MGIIKSFTDLNAWKEAHSLDLFIYNITKSFPKDEQYSLTNQIRRASVSVSSNIAEGFSRRSSLEKRQFFHQALGSLTEVQNQLLIAKDIGYIKQKDFTTIAEQTIIVSKLINSLIKYLNSHT